MKLRARPTHDLKQEPEAPVGTLSINECACLLALSQGPLLRSGKGYAPGKPNVAPEGIIFSVKVIAALEERGLARRLVTIGTGGELRQAWLTGTGAWYVRTLMRRA